MQSSGTLDFGYPWWLSYGHLVILAAALVALAFAWRAGARRGWRVILPGLLAVWAGAAFAVSQSTLNPRARAPLPTPNFLRSGEGKVLDIGAGTGRSTIMVLEARPRATVVAVDLFGRSFERHFGNGGPTQEERLRSNLRAAGVDGRASIEKADMRQLPFEARSFDAAVSCYAMDHLDREGSRQALAEAARVLKPGGEFLFLVIAQDNWTRFAWGPLLSHTTRGPGWWTAAIREAGFDIAEAGTPPGGLFVLARRSANPLP